MVRAARLLGAWALVATLFTTLVATVGAQPTTYTFETSIAASTDDAEERLTTGVVKLTSSDLELTFDHRDQVVGLRFTGVAVPQGSTVTSAYVQFQTDEVSTDPTTLTIQAQAGDDPGTFLAANDDISTRPLTTASVAWAPPPWNTVGEAGVDQRTADLSPVLNEVFARTGWAPGNALVLVVNGSGERVAESANGAFAPLLHVEYQSDGGPPNLAPSVDAGLDATAVLPGAAALGGTVTDDGLPDPPAAVTTTWSQVSGPGTAIFTDPSAPATTATFDVPGPYVLRLTADDGAEVVSDEVTITADPPGPASFETAINAGSDDAEQRLSSGNVKLNSGDLELVYDVGDQAIGLRFTGVTVPAGASITNAYVQFRTDEVSTDATTLSIQAQAADNPGTFTTDNADITSRPLTATSVPWSPPAWNVVGEEGSAQRTPDLSQMLNEVIVRPGWASGNAMVIVVNGSGKRVAEAHEGAGGALLHIDYDTSTGPANAAPTVAAGPDQVVSLLDLATLDGTVTDDGLPDPPAAVTTTWSQTSGPGTATFADPSAVDTTVGFDVAGDYVLRLEADDGQFVTGDELTVAVFDPNPTTVRFAAFGDFGDDGPDDAAVAALVNSFDPDFVVSVGDNSYIPDIDLAVGQHYSSYIGDYNGSYGPGAPVNRFFTAVGNHEYTSLPNGLQDHLDYFTLPGAGIATSGTSGNERYYDFVQGPLHVFVVNSNAQEPDGRTETSAQAQWLQAQLAASTSPWQIVIVHHPPFSSGLGGGSYTVMQWPYAAWGADAVFSGHDHHYERLLAGTFPYFVTGLGGHGRGTLGPPLPTSQAGYDADYGTMIVDACAERLAFSFHSVSAGLIDSYAIGATDCTGVTPINHPPQIFLDANAVVTQPGIAVLDASVFDDGLPNPPSAVTPAWTQVSGPGTTTFADQGAVSTTASFDLPGQYLLELSVDDGEHVTTAQITVDVSPPGSGTLDRPITSSTDDAEERGTGSMRLFSTDLELVYDGGADQLVGLRFTGIGIPAGATITNAYIQFQTDEVSTGSTSLSIRGQAADNPSTFAFSSGDISARPLTAASVAWTPAGWGSVGEAGPDQRTPDLSPILSELLARPGWTAGNAMALIVSGTGERVAESFDGSSPPVLHIEFDTTPPPPPADPVVELVATDSSAAEPGLDEGVVTISRDTSLGDLLVFYSTAGSATDGVDYDGLSGSVVIPDGATSVTVTITPLDDTETEGPETATLALVADPAYDIGLLNADTVTIADDD